VLEFKDSKQTQIAINILQEDNKFIANKPINVQGTFKWKGKQDAAEKLLSFNS
jgi:flagellar hook assembly protein FlgD